jgi:hypothetical protein
LLHNEAIRPQESPKLSQKFAGPFIISQCKPNFNFRLQHLMTGKMLKRPVHASRLQVFRERNNEFHWSQTRSRPCLLTEHTPARRLELRIMIADIASIHVDVTVSPTDELLRNETGPSRAIAEAVGDGVRAECANYITANERLPLNTPLFTSAGNRTPQV